MVSASTRRDRHGRRRRARLVGPAAEVGGRTVRVPLWRSRVDVFVDLVDDAFAALIGRWPEELAGVRVQVEDVPDPDAPTDDAVADETSGGAVPLAQVSGRTLVIYRKPVEARAEDRDDLADLVQEVVVDLVAQLLDVDPGTVDPEGDGP